MKKNISFLLFFCCINFLFLHAQTNRCGTAILHKMRMETDPQYKAFYENIEQRMKEWQSQKAEQRTSAVTLTIPVVVHVVYNAAEENVSDAQIHSQIDVLTQDYSATNANIVNVPPAFQSVIGNANLSFCLATLTPTGEYTTGIERRQTPVTDFGFDDPRLKFTSQGGLDSWDSQKYMNIWVCNMGTSILGYTEAPGSPPQTDGLVITYKAFGTIGNLLPAYNKGRTTTHEAGHWLGLFHIWGDDGGTCTGSDYVNDTPNQASEDYGCPSYPKTDACSPNAPGIMFMNYMDYTNDACMNMFTQGQVAVMNNILNTQRSTLFTSNGCLIPNTFKDFNAESFVALYPNPAKDIIHLNMMLPSVSVVSVTAYDMVGRIISFTEINKSGEQAIDLNTSSFSPGLYTLILNTDKGNIAKRCMIAK